MSKDYVIVVDSTTDLSPKNAEEWGLEVIPYIFTLDGKEYFNYLDYRQLSVRDFYDALRSGKTASTTQVTSHRYFEIWEPFLKEGKDILYMCLSSALSKSYEQSVLAARDAKAAYPNQKIITIDTKSASVGQALLGYHASKARKEGKTLEENAQNIVNLIPRLHHWVMADDLHHLRRGVRVSGASAFVGTMLSIKPVIHVVPDGRLVPMHKIRGRVKALEFILERMVEYGHDVKEQPVFLAHSDVPEVAEQMRKLVEGKFGTKEFVINDIGPVIGAHTGPGTLAVVFLAAKPRVEAS